MRARVGHIGSALCVADIVAALYGSVLNVSSPNDLNRDRFILSKGHAALALYAAFHLKGWLTRDQLDTFCGEASQLGVHPEHSLEGVDFSTGSLGQGLSFGVGAALAARLQKSSRQVFVLVSDAECNEGSVWEAAMFAAQHQLSNLTMIVDLNGQQALNFTDQVLDLSNMRERFGTFGWQSEEIDGHDFDNLKKQLRPTKDSGRPRVFIARTTFGKGVSYMENKIKWHYMPMNAEEYETALSELAVSK